MGITVTPKNALIGGNFRKSPKSSHELLFPNTCYVMQALVWTNLSLGIVCGKIYRNV